MTRRGWGWWGRWGSNPRPADYEKHGLLHTSAGCIDDTDHRTDGTHRGEHGHPQAGGAPRRPQLRRRARLLLANPISRVQWRAPRATVAVNPATIASPAQIRAILAQVSRIRSELAAFFGGLYDAALRPEEAVALRREDLILPAHGRGTIILAAACPAAAPPGPAPAGPVRHAASAPPRRHDLRRPQPARPGPHPAPSDAASDAVRVRLYQLDAGGTLDEVQDLLGHVSISSRRSITSRPGPAACCGGHGAQPARGAGGGRTPE